MAIQYRSRNNGPKPLDRKHAVKGHKKRAVRTAEFNFPRFSYQQRAQVIKPFTRDR